MARAGAASTAVRAVQVELADHGADAGDARTALGRRDEGQAVLVPGRAAAVVAEQVHVRRQAAGRQQQVAADARTGVDGDVLVRVELHQLRAGDTATARGVGDAVALEDVDAELARRIVPRRQGTAGAGIAQDHARPGGGQVGRCAIGPVVAGQDQHALAGTDRIAVQVGLSRGGRHHARQVVVTEHQRAFDRAGREHHVARPDLVHTLARQQRIACGGDDMVLQQFHRLDQVPVVHGERGGAWEARHVSQRVQLGQAALYPRIGRTLVQHGVMVGQQPAAHLGLLVDQHHAQPGPGRDQRRPDAAGAAANDQHVRMVVQVVVEFRIRIDRRTSIAGRAADDVLVQRPHLRRCHEGLVIEAGRHEARGAAHDALDVDVQRGPAGRGKRIHALVQLDLRRLQVRHRARSAFELDQRIRFLGAVADDAARTAVLEAAADHAHAVGQQGGRQRVARVALVGLAVEREIDGLVAPDARIGTIDTMRVHACSSR